MWFSVNDILKVFLKGIFVQKCSKLIILSRLSRISMENLIRKTDCFKLDEHLFV